MRVPCIAGFPCAALTHPARTRSIIEGTKASLERLQLDYVDVLQCHRWDPDTPVEETMRALHDVVQAGNVRYIGMSSCWACVLGHIRP